MIKNLLKKVTIRGLIFTILTFVSYIFVIIYLFWLHDILRSTTFIFMTFIFFHFLFIDLKSIKLWHFILILAWLCIIEILLFFILKRELNIRIILSLIILNWAIWALFYSIEMVHFNSIWYFTRWWYIFTLCISIMYSVAFLGMFQSFPFTCQWLNDASDKLFEFIEKPFVMIKNKKIENNKSEENVTNLTNNLNEPEFSTYEKESNRKIAKKINTFKENTIDQIILDKSEYSEWVCDLLLNEINTILATGWVKRSVVLLSYLLLYWFIRIAIFIMSWIAFILFKILYWSKVYKIVETTKKVNEIY